MSIRVLLGLTTLLLLPSLSVAQLPAPALDFVYPAGAQVGTTVVVEVGGRDLDEARQLVFSHPGFVGVPVTRPAGEFESGDQIVPNQFRIEVPVNLPPGKYDVRVVGRFGVSTRARS